MLDVDPDSNRIPKPPPERERLWVLAVWALLMLAIYGLELWAMRVLCFFPREHVLPW